MTFDDLLTLFSTGFTLDRTDELRVAAAGLKVTKAQRKQLAALIEQARTQGRVGRVANLMLIGLVTDQEYWLDWIRRSPVLRPSSYDLNATTPLKLLPILRKITERLGLSSAFEAFLDSLEPLFALALAAHVTEVRLRKLMGRDPLLIKSCLVTVDLLFIGRTEAITAKNVELSPEDAAAALSYLIFLVRKRFGVSSISLHGIDRKKINSGHYLAILEETWKCIWATANCALNFVWSNVARFMSDFALTQHVKLIDTQFLDSHRRMCGHEYLQRRCFLLRSQ